MATLTFGLFTVCAITIHPKTAIAKVEEMYGSTGTYTVIRNTNQACIAISQNRRSPYMTVDQFGFGVLHIDGDFYAMVVAIENDYDIPNGTWEQGAVLVDGERFDVTFTADGKTMVSGYYPGYELLDAVFTGYEITFVFPKFTEKVSLDGTINAKRLLIECTKDLIRLYGDEGRSNPFGSDDKGQRNPF